MQDARCKMKDAKELLVNTSVNKHRPSSILHPAFSAPTKNDVLIGPEYAVWNSGQSPNDEVLNFYYDDVPTVGGYNHFELRRHRRAYELPNPNSTEPFFRKDDLTPPFEVLVDWFETQVFDN
jgi:hypothetical protein